VDDVREHNKDAFGLLKLKDECPISNENDESTYLSENFDHDL
jgi:hypothetical protein